MKKTKTGWMQVVYAALSTILFSGVLVFVAMIFDVVRLDQQDLKLEQNQEMLQTFQNQLKARELSGVEVIIHPSQDVILSFGSTCEVNVGKYIFHNAGSENVICLMDLYRKVADKITFGDLKYVQHGDLLIVWYDKQSAEGHKVPLSPDLWNAPAYYWDRGSGLAIAVIPILGPPTEGLIIK